MFKELLTNKLNENLVNSTQDIFKGTTKIKDAKLPSSHPLYKKFDMISSKFEKEYPFELLSDTINTFQYEKNNETGYDLIFKLNIKDVELSNYLNSFEIDSRDLKSMGKYIKKIDSDIENVFFLKTKHYYDVYVRVK
jgi:hypothetical protein